MKYIENKRISELSWIHRGGMATNYYEPESVEELVELVRSFYYTGEKFDLVGITSNIYFKDSYNVDNLVSTKQINRYTEDDSVITAECGVNVARLSREMVAKGVKGFEGLIDLPGTVGGGVSLETLDVMVVF